MFNTAIRTCLAPVFNMFHVTHKQKMSCLPYETSSIEFESDKIAERCGAKNSLSLCASIEIPVFACFFRICVTFPIEKPLKIKSKTV